MTRVPLPGLQRDRVMHLERVFAIGTTGSLLLLTVSVTAVAVFAGRPSALVIGLPLAALFGWGTWSLSPRGIRSYRPGRLARAQDRVFDTKLMRRLVPPPRDR